MPKRKIEEEVTETREHTIKICDYCMQREYDAERGLAIRRPDRDLKLYFCSHCLDELRENNTGEDMAVYRKREWLETGIGPSETVKGVLTKAQAGIAITAILYVGVIVFPSGAVYFGLYAMLFAVISLSLVTESKRVEA